MIVVDDCSTDGQWELLNKLYSSDNRVKIIRNEKNIGCLGSRVRAIVSSRGDYVLPLDADDSFEPNAF